jgi:hypothetical protein
MKACGVVEAWFHTLINLGNGWKVRAPTALPML